MAAVDLSAYPRVDLAFIGGTGLSKAEGLENVITVEPFETPFGKPSSPIVIGTINGLTVAFLCRHGLSHSVQPTDVPYRANIFALKSLGANNLVSFGAVGSLQEELAPKHFVVVDQFIDRTKFRQSENTFYDREGLVAHVSFGEPTCKTLSQLVVDSCSRIETIPKTHATGTYVCMEGPCFSSRAESKMYRMWGGSIIGMTCLQEAKLAREAEMAFACVGMVTDYDAWKDEAEPVTVEEVVKILHDNGDNARRVIQEVAKSFTKFESSAHSAMKFSLLKPASSLSDDLKKTYAPILAKYY
ncbi:5'-methylthioadenosine phosphorylase [Naegleria gruberi]|uniref:S-methyl-5'-thioadenosine phosphorylase n=1 Tax=Naegleria gruberi TaxID=5762 RepID=D2V2R7_NAEGR|nr:5'-methylthioadenosine phosphorylase [Naegleria gruberi]EFC48943.1 5'-methylthioadenosine phosphorylase [Naegleria gruberi]|eukprot:XP_002681687.1 5'-methylthioadenosine phosphorylase [Naegleria gruberi strain NEG-M]